MPISSFTLSNISIIESLPHSEVKTGTHLAQYIDGLDLQSTLGLQLCSISSAKELIDHLLEIEQAAKAGELPIIHFEMHGTPDGRGLVTANSDILPWVEISTILFRINSATNFNLIVFIAACNGGYFLEEIKPNSSAPCYALVAPTDEVDPSEIMRATREFYRTLLMTKDATKAVSTIQNQPIQQGRWFAHSAESWYWTVASLHVRSECSPKALKNRAKEIHARLKSNGIDANMGKIKQEIKTSTHKNLTEAYFNRFFCIDSIPENSKRFGYLRDSISKKIEELLNKPQNQ